MEIKFESKDKITTKFGKIRLDDRIETGFRKVDATIWYDTAFPEPNIILTKPGKHFYGGEWDWEWDKIKLEWVKIWVETPLSKYKYVIVCLNAVSDTAKMIDIHKDKRRILYCIYKFTDSKAEVYKLYRHLESIGRIRPKWKT